MGMFGFFLFLSVIVIARNWRIVYVAQLQRDMLARLLESGQGVDFEKLTLLRNPPQPIAWAQWKIGTLLVLGVGTLILSWIYRAEGTFPLLVAGLLALAVAYATWEHERKLAMTNGSVR